MEMGTGKSKVLIDNIGMLYMQKELDFALIIAPKGVYPTGYRRNSEHMPDDIPVRVIRWVAGANKSSKKKCARSKTSSMG